MIVGGMLLIVFVEIVKDGFFFMGLVLFVVVLSFGIGWLFVKYQVLLGMIVIWGLLLGVVSVMVLMVEVVGVDFCFVVFM